MTDEWRRQFPILETKAYLNSCSCGALSRRVEAAYHDYLASRHARGADWDRWVGKLETVRDLFARLVNAHADEVAVTTSASAGLNALVSALKSQGARNRIVVSDFEFPTVGQIWHAQAPRGFETVMAGEQTGAIPLETFDRLIDERTLAVSIAMVCYRNGAMSDIAKIAELAHSRGALVILDAYQALGAVPVDVKALGIDAMIGGAAKYLLSSAGLGFLYVRQSLIGQLDPSVTGWFAQRDIFAMDHRRHDPADTARRFESGTPAIPNLYAGEAGLSLMLEAGVEATRAHVLDLTQRLKDGVTALGGVLATPAEPERHGAMIAIRSTDDHGLVVRLKDQNIITSCRDGNARVSPHFYNNTDDIGRLLEALRVNRDLLVMAA